MHDPESMIVEFERMSQLVLEMLHRGVLLTGIQENTLVDTIHDLQMGYGEWLRHTTQKEQSFPPDQPRRLTTR
jgi:restriction endonuclease Mrr